MAKIISKLLGIIFILVGLCGFVAPNLLGMHLTLTHNIIHLISGALALFFGFESSSSAARNFCLIFGITYFLLGALGFFAPNIIASLLHANDVANTATDLTPDNLVHIILGGIFFMGGLYSAPQTTPTTTEI